MGSQQGSVDLRESARMGSPTPQDAPSPRSGEVPPALSPLDAFALQGRMLAQRLEASHINGNRMSRLPPLMIANELAKPRVNYFNPSPSESRIDSEISPSSAYPESAVSTAEVDESKFRPMSHYPLLQSSDDDRASILTVESLPTIKRVPEDIEEEEEPEESGSEAGSDLLNAVLPERSTFEALAPISSSVGASADEQLPASTNSEQVLEPEPELESGLGPQTVPEPEPPTDFERKSSVSSSIRTNGSRRLAPPGLQLFPKSGRPLKEQTSIRSVGPDTRDDSDSLSLPGDHYDSRSKERKPSINSVSSRSRSPFSPVFAPPRSPSLSSDHIQPPRASVNFSRPLSRAGKPSCEARPSVESLSRHRFVESPPPRPSQDSVMDSPQFLPPLRSDNTPPLSISEDESSYSLGGSSAGAPTYTYTKFQLPRARNYSESSTPASDEPAYKFEFELETNGSNIEEPSGKDHHSPIHTETFQRRFSRTLLSLEADINQQQSLARVQFAEGGEAPQRISAHKPSPSFPPPSASSSSLPGSTDASAAGKHPLSHSVNQSSPLARPSTADPRGGSSTQATPDLSKLAESLKQLTPEGHLAKGIRCHEDGEVQKSTYHLRLAARGGNVTAMLLYALACRHGWGMRPNQAEGVNWLRKAVDSAGLEVADDEALPLGDIRTGSQIDGDGTVNDVVARRTHKAQLALSIYELGVSYMKGWGIAQDKTLGLRCFEIAGGWGDVDALVEAGFCYSKGVGCKKDLRKAAEFYRRAAKNGADMTGNSWIYKDKYMPTDESGEVARSRTVEKEKEKDRKPRDKSRTRTIFGGRKKHLQQLQDSAS